MRLSHPLDPRQTQHELLRDLAPQAKSYLEVGVQEGRSLDVVCRASQLDLVTLLDDWGTTSGGSGRGSHAHIDEQLQMDGVHKPTNVVYVDGDSQVTFKSVTQAHDLVHIDGGHSFDVALSDLRNGWRVCKNTMVVHDIRMTEVWRALNTFLDEVDRISVQCFFGGHGTAVVFRWDLL